VRKLMYDEPGREEENSHGRGGPIREDTTGKERKPNRGNEDDSNHNVPDLSRAESNP